ncbi:hypothetical protein MR829_24020 [Paracoccus versutus]|uniref:hypothetical protein n=1 Tax=Paracoccus versutus TaxID=34007 RepID=UPI001FB7D582|nr:hypothetical protein [Paracoccus versutus]MCJ1903382.1 hypothetical protein [Paracoccus versutus]
MRQQLGTVGAGQSGKLRNLPGIAGAERILLHAHSGAEFGQGAAAILLVLIRIGTALH